MQKKKKKKKKKRNVLPSKLRPVIPIKKLPKISV